MTEEYNVCKEIAEAKAKELATKDLENHVQHQLTWLKIQVSEMEQKLRYERLYHLHFYNLMVYLMPSLLPL